MSFAYVPWESSVFGEQLALLPPADQILIFEAIETRLKYDPCLEKPPVRSKLLDVPAECIRRIHVTNDLLIAYTVCDNCRNISCDKKLRCFRCYEQPSYRIKLIACGPFAGFYDELENNYSRWLNTVKERVAS